MRLIVATKNNDKSKEIKGILKGLGVSIVSLNELEKKFRIVENGKTFQENAFKKALPVSRHYKNDYILGEDSGLEVNYLNGAPGIYAKRYSGPKATYESNNKKLLKNLQGVPAKKRGAAFCCCLVLACDGKLVKVFEGRLKGRIWDKARGENGFGYDPVFYLDQYKKTVAQLPLLTKNKISHRGKAFRKLRKYFCCRRPILGVK